jgi:hypothetical protein
MQKIFAFFLCITFFLQTIYANELPEEEFLYLIKDKKNDDKKNKKLKNEEDESKLLHNKRIKDFIRNQSKQLIDQNLDASGNIISKGAISLGFKLLIKKLKPEEIFLDTDKFSNYHSPSDNKYYQHNWYRYVVSATPILGSNDILSLFDGVKLPLTMSLGLGARIGSEKRYELIVPQSIEAMHDAKSSKILLTHLKDSSKVYRMVLPTKAKHFTNIKRFPSGSEFNWKRSNFALFALGLNLPTNFVQAGIRTYFLIEGNLHKRMKIFRVSGKTFVQVELINESEKSNEEAVEATLGYSIFETSSSQINIGLRVLSASRSHIKNNSFKIVYVFDLSYQHALDALNEVMKNNFVKAQQYAVDHTNPNHMTDNYQGIVLLENHTQEFLSNIYALNAGLFNSRLRGRFDKISFSLNRFIPDVFLYSSSKSKTISKGEYNYPYSMPINRVSLTLKKEKSNKILNGLWANKNKSILYNNEHLTYQTLSEEINKVNQITIQERLSNKRNSPKTFKKFYEPSRYIFQLLKPNLSGLLHHFEQKQECYKNYVMNKHLMLQDSAIKKIISAEDKYFYQAFATLFNINESNWWEDPLLRSKKLKAYKKSFLDQDSITSPLKSYIKNIYSLYEKMEKEQTHQKLKTLEAKSLEELLKEDTQLNQVDHSKFQPNSYKEALIFHLAFKELILEPGFIDYMAILSEIISPQNYFHGFSLKSDNCNVQWISSQQSTTDPELISKEIEEYDLNFWDN